MQAENIEDKIKRMLDKLPATVSNFAGTFSNDILTAVALELNRADIDNETLFEKLDLRNLNGTELANKIYEYVGITRRRATTANGELTFIGEEGSFIDEGIIVSAGGIDFKTTEKVTIDATGEAFVKVECTQSGALGNVRANSINSLLVPINGIANVFNVLEFNNGYDEESDESLFKRYEEKRQKPAKAGNVHHYEQWAMEISGIGGVKVYPRTPNLLDITIVLIDQNGQPPSDELIDQVRGHIEKNMPFGVNLFINKANPLAIKLQLSLKLSANYNIDSIKKAIEKNIAAYFKTVALSGDYISLAKVGKSILEIDGIIDYQNLTLNGQSKNIELLNDEVPTLESVEIAIIK